MSRKAEPTRWAGLEIDRSLLLALHENPLEDGFKVGGQVHRSPKQCQGCWEYTIQHSSIPDFMIGMALSVAPFVLQRSESISTIKSKG